jgi:alpha-L-fucosidase 2
VGGAENNIFAIDGNCAGAAGIAEMLVQSRAGEIHLLPALPSAWPRGSVTGLCARGGVEVSLWWAAGRLTSASLRSRMGGTYTVRYGATTIPVTLQRGRETKVFARNFTPPRPAAG